MFKNREQRSLSHCDSRTELERSKALAHLSRDALCYNVGNYESKTHDSILHSLNYFFANLVDQVSRHSILIYVSFINNIQHKPIKTQADKEKLCDAMAALTAGLFNQQFLNLLVKLIIQLKYLITVVENSTFDSLTLRDVGINENETYDSYNYLTSLQEVLNILEEDLMAPKSIKTLHSSQQEYKSHLPGQPLGEPIMLEELAITSDEDITILSPAPQYNNKQISSTSLAHSSKSLNLLDECNDILFVINFILPELHDHKHFCQGLRNILNSNNDAIEKLYMIIEHTTSYELEDEPRPIKKVSCYSHFFTCHSAKVTPQSSDKFKEFQDIMANITMREITEDSARHIKNNLRGLIEITAARQSMV